MNQRAPGSTVLRMVANGMNLLNIEVETDWSPDDIKVLALEEGYGLNAANGRFQKVAKAKPAPSGIVRASQTDTGATDEGPPSREQTHSAVAPVSRIVEAVPEPARITLDPAPVISAGLAHGDPDVRGLAATARDTITALAAALVEYEQRGEALAEVARLEEELAAARVRAGIARPKRPPVNPEAKRIRAWAADNGIPCTRTGIVPKTVVEAYIAAHEDGAA